MRKTGRLRELRTSLLSRYLLIIIVAMLFIPIVIPLTIAMYNLFNGLSREEPEESAAYKSISGLETTWHKEAEGLLGKPPEAINERLRELRAAYNFSSIFWVDGEGRTRLSLEPADPELWQQNEKYAIPAQWTAADAILFMKKSSALDPLAIVAFVGDRPDAGEGFMVMQIPSAVRKQDSFEGLNSWYMAVMLVLFIGFIMVSWLFFIRIRKRLLRLQTAMIFTEEAGVPPLIAPGKPDEIGRLETAFNTMVAELAASRLREAEEEGLRKRLVSGLSHDLRTPLTVIRSHLHILGKEELSGRGRESLRLMDERIESLGVLIENLLSYNLLSSGRMTLKPERRDVLRLLRESAAAWYPLWEKEGFRIDIDLEGEPLYWNVDESWFRRILDNLFQNIVRHARSGLYVGVAVEMRDGERVILIRDQGKGLGSSSRAKGAGMGLSIVDLLVKRMGLEWKVDSTSEGTRIVIRSLPSGNLNKI
ncbi:HAMP domain-containing sensor histidine kinase [Paenibacillus sp. S150]|uniref:sensor histidine kinase n=1 Tax=Paenibacillus sp. S150 TaxID=2749826 RepID=UPI001C593E31|nr:HAMP domain-containing sensor histidine kinase [Paenibacillus sp. S150]MBW4085312.1 HAMP domain-containing histidine kinase [Paenibacillus sp. S150]